MAKRIVDATAKGLPRNTVAKIAGVTDRALYNWLAAGRAGDPTYVQFFQRVAEAERAGEERLVAVMESHAEKYWQACAWLLERRNPQAFAKPDAATQTASERDDAAEQDDVAVLESILAAAKSRAG